MQYELDPYEKIFNKYEKKYNFNIYLSDIINKAGYTLTISNQKEYEEIEMPYSLYYNMGSVEFDSLISRMCKQLLFKIEMDDIINARD